LKRLRISKLLSRKALFRWFAILLVASLTAPQAWAWYQLRSAKSALTHYHPEEARQSLSSCLGVWDYSSAAHLLMSRAARQDGDLETAARELSIAQRLTAGATNETAFEWALLQAAAGNVREVEEYLQKHVNQYPETGPLAWEALAEGYLRNHRNSDAMICLDTWLKRAPEDVRALELRGRTFIAGKGVVNGTKDFRRVLALDPNRRQTRWRLIVGLINLGTYDEAADLLESLVREQPDNPDYASRLARCYIMLNRRDEARQLLERMLAKYPDDGPCLRVRGQFALTHSSDTTSAEEAEGWMRHAARILPEDYQTQWLLFESLRRQGKSAEANEQHQKAELVKDRMERLSELSSSKLGEQPLDPALHYEMGMLFIRTERADVGESWLLIALNLDPNHKPSHAALADYYGRIGKRQLAEEHRKKSEKW
jgi:tetratricopeptide (TPR) repeat protein